MKYLSVEQLTEINKRVVQEIRVKKGDSHKVLNRGALRDTCTKVEVLDGDVYEKAACLLVNVTRRHAFASANRRTAYTAAAEFLRINGAEMKAGSDFTVLTGIREDFYKTEEVVEWLKGHEIRRFSRF